MHQIMEGEQGEGEQGEGGSPEESGMDTEEQCPTLEGHQQPDREHCGAPRDLFPSGLHKGQPLLCSGARASTWGTASLVLCYGDRR